MLVSYPWIEYAFIPVGSYWMNHQEPWWRIFRRYTLARHDFADPDDITTAQLNSQSESWVWESAPPTPRCIRRRFVYRL